MGEVQSERAIGVAGGFSNQEGGSRLSKGPTSGDENVSKCFYDGKVSKVANYGGGWGGSSDSL